MEVDGWLSVDVDGRLAGVTGISSSSDELNVIFSIVNPAEGRPRGWPSKGEPEEVSSGLSAGGGRSSILFFRLLTMLSSKLSIP